MQEMQLQPIIKNNLVRLQPLKKEHMEALYEVAKDPKIWEQHPCKRYLRSEFDSFFKESLASKAALIIIDLKTDQIIGSSRYKIIDNFPNSVEIGWTFLSRDYWGGAYNTAVKQLMIAHAFKYMQHIILYVDIYNIRSQKAVQKLGGELIDTAKYPELPDRTSDDLVFLIEKRLFH